MNDVNNKWTKITIDNSCNRHSITIKDWEWMGSWNSMFLYLECKSSQGASEPANRQIQIKIRSFNTEGCVKVQSDPVSQDITEWGEQRTSDRDPVTSTTDLGSRLGLEDSLWSSYRSSYSVTKESLRTQGTNQDSLAVMSRGGGGNHLDPVISSLDLRDRRGRRGQFMTYLYTCSAGTTD